MNNTKIKVNLDSGQHSEKRGIGFYAEFLGAKLANFVDLTRTNPDIIHYTYFDLFYPTLPLKKTKPTVVTIHDLTPLVLKSLYPTGIRGALNLLHQKLSQSNASGVITDSQNSKNDIIHFFNISKSKIHVIPLAADPQFSISISHKQLLLVKKKYNLPSQFILYVGGVNPNKNLTLLAQTAIDLNIPLVFVGSEFLKPVFNHPELRPFAELKKIISQRPELFLMPGFVPTLDLVAFYKLASLYCQPSLYEGFGICILEAMTAGCLVVSSFTSSLPEIYPKNTITFNPTDINSLRNALNRAMSLSTLQKNSLLKAAIQRAKDYNWNKTAEKTLEVYQKILNQ